MLRGYALSSPLHWLTLKPRILPGPATRRILLGLATRSLSVYSHSHVVHDVASMPSGHFSKPSTWVVSNE